MITSGCGRKWHSLAGKVRKYLVLSDTTTFGDVGETEGCRGALAGR